MITVVFTLTSVNRALIDGCDFAAVVGNIPELGSWDPTKGARASGPKDTQYVVKVEVPEGLDKIEFKWIFWHGEHISWEVGLNKVIYDLPDMPGSSCCISNALNGPALIKEVKIPRRFFFKRGGASAEDISRYLNPQNWSRRSRNIGLGLSLLLAICVAIKIIH